MADKLFSTLGIRGKIIGIVLGFIIILTLVTLVFVNISFRAAIGVQMDHKAANTISNLIARSREPILTDNIFKLYQLAYDTVEQSEDITYIYYRDTYDNVLIHTFQDYFPPDLLNVEHSFFEEGYSLKKFQTEEGVLRDVAAPAFAWPDPEIIVQR